MNASTIDTVLWFLHGHNDYEYYGEEVVSLIYKIFRKARELEGWENEENYSFFLPAEKGTLEEFVDNRYDLESEGTKYEDYEDEFNSEYKFKTIPFLVNLVRYKSHVYISINKDILINTDDIDKTPYFIRYDDLVKDILVWIYKGLCRLIENVDEYNNSYIQNLPKEYYHSIINVADLFKILPDYKKRFFKDISKEEIDYFVENSRTAEDGMIPYHQMTANKFFEACKIGYEANYLELEEGDEDDFYNQSRRYALHNKGATPKEMYKTYADGRCGDLTNIDENSNEEFLSWYNGETRYGSHPWEICRGGNSTHISLYITKVGDVGFRFNVAGKATTRMVETIKIFNALKRAGIPIDISDRDIIVDFVTERGYIGIVPRGYSPYYAYQDFGEYGVCDVLAWDSLYYEDYYWDIASRVETLPLEGVKKKCNTVTTDTQQDF